MAPRHDRVSSRFRLRLWAVVASPLIGVAAAAILAHGQGKWIAFLLIALPSGYALHGWLNDHKNVRERATA